jgi:hypothetical protein
MIRLETVEGKSMAIDSSIWIYQFQATMRDGMRDKDRRALSNVHVLGFLLRITKLLFCGIKVGSTKSPLTHERFWYETRNQTCFCLNLFIDNLNQWSLDSRNILVPGNQPYPFLASKTDSRARIAATSLNAKL